MKVFLLALFVAAAVALPTPLEEDEIGEPVELIVNGVPDGEPLDLGDVLGVKVKQHIDGELAVATDLLYPLTAQGIAEAAAVAALEPIPGAREIMSDGVVLPEPAAPEVIPEAVILPEPAVPEVIPEPVVLPEPAVPEVVPEIVFEPEIVSPDVVPELAPDHVLEPQIAGEVYNDGLVQVKVNAVLSTVKSWVSMVLNYFNGDVQTTQQIV